MNEKEKIIEYWRRRARECLDDAKLLLKNGRLHSAVNRIYYAFFSPKVFHFPNIVVFWQLLTKNLLKLEK